MTARRVLYLIRHGKADFGSDSYRDTPLGPQFDPPLDATGREQAELLARRLLLLPRPAAVYCSPMRRAVETIAPYADRAGLDVLYDEDLSEAHIGEWEHRPFEEIIADEEIVERLRNQQAFWHLAPGGEDLAALRDRVGRAVQGILGRHPEGDVIVVAHGGVINAYVGALLRVDHEMFFLPENTSMNSVIVEGRSRQLRFLNDVLHLSEPQLFDHG